MMDDGFSKAVWAVVGVVVLAVLLWAKLLPTPGHTLEEAKRIACTAELRNWTVELYTANRSEEFVFSDGLESFLKYLASGATGTISSQSLSFSCPAAELGGGRSRYAIADFTTSEELKQKLMEEGRVVLMSDLHGYHEVGSNVLVAVMEDGELQFQVEWLPNE